MSRLPLERLVEQYLANKDLTEGVVGDVVKKFGSWIKQKALSVVGKIKSLFVRKIAGKNYIMYSTGGEQLNSGTEVGVLIKGPSASKPLSKAIAAYQNTPSQMTIAFREPHVAVQTKSESTSFFSILHQELNEAGRKKAAPAATASNDDNSDVSDDPYLQAGAFKPTKTDVALKTQTTDKTSPSSFIGKLAQDIADPEDELFTPGNMNPALDYPALEALLTDFLTKVHLRGTIGGEVPSVLIQGFPGWGKTNIINNLAKKAKMNLKIIEIASLPTDYLQGLPAIEKNIQQSKDDSGYVLTKEEAHVTMKFIDGILPPSDDSSPWILFLDEFNVNEERMKAAMNLILSGGIGTSYQLPKRTLVVVAGNLGEQIDGVSVQKMHAAVFDRFDAHVFMKLSGKQVNLYGQQRSTKYDVEKIPGVKETFKYAEQEDKEEAAQTATNVEEIRKELTKFPNYTGAIQAFVDNMNKEYGEEWTTAEALELLHIKPMAGYLGKEGDVEDPGTTLSPRRLQKICDIAKEKAVKDWKYAVANKEPLPVSGKGVSKDPAWYVKEYNKKKDFLSKGNILSPIAYYLEVNQWDKQYLPSIIKNALGGAPAELADKIKMAFKDIKSRFKELDINDVIADFDRKYTNKELSDDDVATLSQRFSVEIINRLFEIGSVADLKKLLKSKNISEKELATYDNDPVIWTAVNIEKFFRAGRFTEEIAKAIIGNYLDRIAGKEESKYTEDEKFVLNIILTITELNESFKIAWNICSEIYHEKAKDAPEAEAKANEYIARRSILGDKVIIPTVKGGKIDKELGNKILYVLNMAKLVPDINKSLRIKKEKTGKEPIPEASLIEKGLKSLFERMM